MEANAAKELKSGITIGELWAGVLVGPFAALMQLQINYALVLWSCSHRSTWPLHLVSVMALFLTSVAGLLSFRVWQRISIKEDAAGPAARSRLMSAVGVLISALMALWIIAQWFPIFLYDPCQR